MFSTTPQKLVVMALKKVGVLAANQAPQREDIQDAFEELRLMLAEWSSNRWLVYHLVTTSLLSTGAQTYAVGPGGDFNLALRPDKIESAYFRLSTISPLPPDFTLESLDSMEDYNRLKLKTLTTFPQFYFYDSGWPLGTLYPWPIAPSGNYELFISTKVALQDVVDTSQQLNLPPSYFSAILYNLAARLCSSYKLPPDQVVIALASSGLALVRQTTVQLPRLRLPAAVTGGSGRYNPFSDQGG